MSLHGDAYFWLGSYTSESTNDGGGRGPGISLLRQEEAGTLQLVHSTGHEVGASERRGQRRASDEESPDAIQPASPSWLARHPTLPVLYAALETSGEVQAFTWANPDETSARTDQARTDQDRTTSATDEHPDRTGIRPLGAALEAGETVCHLTVTPDGKSLIASSYGDGRLASFALAPNGALASEAQPAAASVDPYGIGIDPSSIAAAGFSDNPFADLAVEKAVADGTAPRQSRAHTSLVLPNGGVVTTDLGHDTVRFWTRGATAHGHPRLTERGQVTLPFGVGPRHVVLHPSGYLYVVTEYSNEIFVLGETTDATWRVIAAVQATGDSIESGDNASEISLSASQEQVHVSVRGSNRISTLRITGDGSTLSPIGDVDSGGNWPRHHLEDGDLLHVANQLSGQVTTLKLDERGIPRTRVGVLETGSPTCLVRHPIAD